MLDVLARRFEEAALPLTILETPLNPSNPAIFQMDVAPSPGGEVFRLWPGDSTNGIEVRSIDRLFCQVVLLVREARRRFEVIVPKPAWYSAAALRVSGLQSGDRVVGEYRYHWTVERWTDPSDRRLLCGIDESSLFIARVRSGESVVQAHESLKPPEVRNFERRTGTAASRQGEWFFVPLTPDEEDALYERLWNERRRPHRNEAIEEAARPHRAEEVVRFQTPEGMEDVWARGWVRHPDHRTLDLPVWHRVFVNTERLLEPGRPRGVYWID